MREPTYRAWSQAKHNCKYGEANFKGFKGKIKDVKDVSLLENFNHLWSLAYGDYLGILKHWLRHFPKENFFLGFFDDIETNPKQLLINIFEFLGVETNLDWNKFRLREKIFQGLNRDIPAPLNGYLEHIYKDHKVALEDFTQKYFNVWIKLILNAFCYYH